MCHALAAGAQCLWVGSVISQLPDPPFGRPATAAPQVGHGTASRWRAGSTVEVIYRSGGKKVRRALDEKKKKLLFQTFLIHINTYFLQQHARTHPDIDMKEAVGTYEFSSISGAVCS